MKKWIALLGTALLLGCGADYPVRPGGGSDAPSTLRLMPASTMTSVGAEFATAVEVVDAQALFGIAFAISYDAEVLALVGTEVGSALGSDALSFAQDEPGKISMAVTKKRGAVPFTGSGSVATLRFRALRSGRSNLIFEQRAMEAAGDDGLAVANIARFVVQSGSVNVLAGE